MTSSISIIDFIEARLAEDEAAALSATPGQWEEDGYDREYRTVVSQRVTSGIELGDQLAFVASFMDAVHILRHDPARVLREVAAKRRVMERHRRYDGAKYFDYCEGCPSGDDSGYPEVELNDCPELRDLAAPYSDHPDFDPNWSTT